MKYAALIISILGLVTWIDPRIGFFVSYLAFFLGFVSRRKKRSKTALASMIIGGFGFLLSLINAFFGALFMAAM